MSDKINKILIVIVLTLLVWTWAFMSKTKQKSFTGSLAVSPGVDPGLLVTFSLGEDGLQRTEIPLTSLNFTGAPSELSELQKRVQLPPDNPDKESLDFYYDPTEREESSHTLEILGYLQGNIKIQELALSLESATPSEVYVHVEELVNKKVPVECLDENGWAVPGAIPDPALVNIYVRQGFTGSAVATLTKQQINLARKQPVTVKPYVNLGVADVIREAEMPVSITVQSEELLRPRPFQTAKPIGLIISPELQRQYRITILNEDEIRGTTFLFATDEAFTAYQNVEYPFLIEIRESDVTNLSQIPPKPIIYNFPPEYVQSGEIELDKSKISRLARIKIEAVNGGLSP